MEDRRQRRGVGRHHHAGREHVDGAGAEPPWGVRTGREQSPAFAARYYRGSLRAVTGSQGELRTVNSVPLNLYVAGVVPREMPASWGGDAGDKGMNALRAQAVAAQSIARVESLHVRQDLRQPELSGVRRRRLSSRRERPGRADADRGHRVAVLEPGRRRHERCGRDVGRSRRQHALRRVNGGTRPRASSIRATSTHRSRTTTRGPPRSPSVPFRRPTRRSAC